MEFQDNLLQGKNHSGPTAMLLVLKNLMLMVTSLLGAPVKKISIRKLNNHGLIQTTKVIKNQKDIQWVSL